MMDCNRDDALRSKDLAEQRLASQDYHGALKFLQKALQLFPALENTSQISAVIEVHTAAQVKINGTEMDWYGILQVDPGAEDIVIKKQYKKFALLLHPDKNKYAGSEAAFKLIGEALQVLSDKQQRMLYDSRRKPRARASTQKKQSRQTTSQRQTAGHMYAHTPAALSNTFFTVCPACHTRYQYYRVYLDQNLLCHQCARPFLAREIFPSASNETYSAYGWEHFSQTQTGFNNVNSFQQFASAANFTSGMSYASQSVHGMAQNIGVPGGVPTADNVNQTFNEKAHMQQEADEHKRKRKDEKDSEKEMRKMEREQQKKAKADQRAQELLEREMLKKRKQAEKESQKGRKRQSKKQSSDSSDDDDDDSDIEENLSDIEILNHVVDPELAPRRSSRSKRNVTYRVDASDDEEAVPTSSNVQSPNSAQKTHATNAAQLNPSEGTGWNTNVPQDGDLAEKQRLAKLAKGNILANLAKYTAAMKADDSVKTNNGHAAKADQTLHEGQSARDYKNGEYLSETTASIKVEGKFMQTEEKHKVADQTKEVTETVSRENSEAKDDTGEDKKHETYTLPDPEFFDFDADRKNIRAGQVWASYDDVDGLPRFYLKVKAVLSVDPFRVSISWLELQSLSADQKSLKRLGFLPTCGSSFKATSSQTLDSVDMLSHILKWEKGFKGMVAIYPRKGDVWALYRNWKPGLPTRQKSLLQEYEMVEVLTDFDKLVGVSVAHLEKLPLHKTLFKRTNNCREIPIAELCRFSYHVPAYQLQEHETPDHEKGCWELDPASVPLADMIQGSGE